MKVVHIFSAILSIYLLICISGFVTAEQTLDTENVEGNIFLNVITCMFCRIFFLFFYFASAVTALIIVVAGIKWIASGDDTSARGAAKNSIIHAIVGLIIVLISVFLVWWFVESVSAVQMLNPEIFIDGCAVECSF